MRKLIFILSLFLSVTVSGQLSMAGLGSVASSGAVSTTNYGDDTYTGTNVQVFLETNVHYTGPITVVDGGTVLSINWWIDSPLSTNSACALYTDNGGVPDALVANSITGGRADADAQYNEFTFSTDPTVSDATLYWIGSISTGGNHLMFDNTTGTASVYYETGTSFPATASNLNLFDDTALIPNYITVQH